MLHAASQEHSESLITVALRVRGCQPALKSCDSTQFDLIVDLGARASLDIDALEGVIPYRRMGAFHIVEGVELRRHGVSGRPRGLVKSS